jgi:hypothetical protein
MPATVNATASSAGCGFSCTDGSRAVFLVMAVLPNMMRVM